jgi:tetratricopeptide (TPR) repeat protein
MDEAAKLKVTELPSTQSDMQLLARCEHALELMLTHRGNPSAEIDRVLADDPECVLAHCLRAALIICGDATAARSSIAASAAVIELTCAHSHGLARRHAAAARAWIEGGAEPAIDHYGAILIDHPRDILALLVAHALDFRLGRRRMLRDRVARVLSRWKSGMPGYASVLAMYAFGLEENGQYRGAEKIARRALALDPGHPRAIHALAHVMEMQGRFREGLSFLAATEPAWIEGTGFSVHLAWHRALFYLDADDVGSALAAYDAQIANDPAPRMSTLADASALLWRLQLRNVEVGGRWRLLADRWETQNLDDARSFYIVHAVMAFAAAGRTSAAERVFDELPRVDKGRVSFSLPEDALAFPFCKALTAFASKDYVACIEWMKQVHHIAHRCGGSLAQCDLIHLTLTEAALRTPDMQLARTLVAERTAQKPTSRINRLLRQRLRMIMPAIAGGFVSARLV